VDGVRDATPGSENPVEAERATSFGSVAELYDQYRPGPPAEIAEWLLPPGADRAADVCAGTGALSRILAGRVRHVVAVDLDLRMLAVLRTRSPAPDAVCGRGETTPLRGGAFDAVLVSSGWHWLDSARAVPEMARLLRPGGLLGVVWSGPDRRIDWVGDLLPRRRTDVDARPRPERQLIIAADQPFGRPEMRAIDWLLPRTRSQLVGLAGTYSRVITSGSAQRLAVAHHASEVIQQHSLFSRRARIDLPMITCCWRAARLPT
jgi:SAM-dependent methyltransferase